MRRTTPLISKSTSRFISNLELLFAASLFITRGIAQMGNDDGNSLWNAGAAIADVTLLTLSLTTILGHCTSSKPSADEVSAMEQGYSRLDNKKHDVTLPSKFSQAVHFAQNALLTGAGISGLIFTLAGNKLVSLTATQETVFSGMFITGCTLLQAQTTANKNYLQHSRGISTITNQCTIASMVGLIAFQLSFSLGASLNYNQGNQQTAGISNIVAGALTLSLAAINVFAGLCKGTQQRQKQDELPCIDKTFVIDFDSDSGEDEDLGYKSSKR